MPPAARASAASRRPRSRAVPGLRLQHALPNARVVYVSATGATTVHNLAYAQRLGLWGGEDFPFATRAEFVAAIEAGGVAAMEVLARDLKSLGLYAARSLSYEGVEYELVEHALTPEQIRIYDAYAGAFQIIHNNLDAALQAANVTGERGTLNAQAKSAARSAFESAKQRFFSHLITSMKTPTLIAAIERDLDAGHAAVVQIVSTGEALMERRLADIPTEEWGDVQVDITPREYVLDYLAHSFPTQLFEPFTDGEGNLSSRPVYRDGQPVQCRDAVERRDRLIERLASLAPVQGALDQIVQRFGTDMVAEVTGRSRRIVRKGDRLCVENRPGLRQSRRGAGLHGRRQAHPRLLAMPAAPGRSYHADLCARNQRLRVHYLLEAGWKADTAIQGLGRSNRTNQAQPPLFRPIATDVKAEKRFLSTIARRLDTLGAITKGQRQTGGQGLFRADDNLESPYGRAALRQLYLLLFAGKVEGCSLDAFQAATGLHLTDQDGSLREELPPITTFLNRLLALTIELQNTLFGAFEELLQAKIEGARASGTYDVGVETLTAESLVVTDRRALYVHPQTGAETQVFTIRRRERNRPFTLAEALDRADDPRAALAGERAVRPRRRPGPGAQRHAGRWRGRTPCPPAAPDGADSHVLGGAGAHPLATGRSCRLRRGLGAGTRRDPRFHRQRSSHRHRAAVADLEAAAGRVHAGLPPADRCRRTRHRPAGLAGLGRAGRQRRRREHRTRGCLVGRSRRPHDPRTAGWAEPAPRQGDGLVPGRALRLHRGHGRSPEGDGADLRDHHLEAPPVRSDQRSGPAILAELMERYPLVRIADRRGVRRQPCRRTPRTWPAASRATPRRCAVTTSPTAIGRAATGWSAMSPTREAAACLSALSGPDHGKGAAGKWTDAATGEHGDLLGPHRAQPRSRPAARHPRGGTRVPCHAS